jgi:predicted ester cyclase
VPLEDNLRAVRRLIDAWNSHDLGRIEPFFHENFENHQLPFAPVIGLAAYLEHCRHWFTAYPDFHLTALTLFGQGELVCLESRGEGTRVAPFFGEPPGGRREVNFALDVLEFADGKVKRERGYWDFSVATGRPAPMAGGHTDRTSAFFAGGDLSGQRTAS